MPNHASYEQEHERYIVLTFVDNTFGESLWSNLESAIKYATACVKRDEKDQYYYTGKATIIDKRTAEQLYLLEQCPHWMKNELPDEPFVSGEVIHIYFF